MIIISTRFNLATSLGQRLAGIRQRRFISVTVVVALVSTGVVEPLTLTKALFCLGLAHTAAMWPALFPLQRLLIGTLDLKFILILRQ